SGPEGKRRGSTWPVARILTCVPPMSTASTFMVVPPRSRSAGNPSRHHMHGRSKNHIHHKGTKDTKRRERGEEKKEEEQGLWRRVVDCLFLVFFVSFVPLW